MTDTRTREHLDELVRGFDVAMLVTRTDGGLHARPMAIAEIDGAGDVWFVTERDSGKVAEISRESEVNVTLQGNLVYATISGLAEPVEDRDRIRRLWKEGWRVWFPEGPDTKDLVALRVTPTRGEYWDNRGPKGLRYVWKALLAYVRGERLDDRSLPDAHHGLAEL